MKSITAFTVRIQLLAVAFFCFIVQSPADEICQLRLQKCPEDFHNTRIIVPKKVNAMASNFFVCMPHNFIESVEGKGSPSIIFVIDHSTSMSGLSASVSTPTDVNGSRFTVTQALIDTIQKKNPKAEVGLIVFQNLLYIDTKNQPYAVPLPSTYPYPSGVTTQGYIPLMQLDSTLSNGLKAVDMLKNFLKTQQVQRPDNKGLTTDLAYKPVFTKINLGTNINTAFDAAKYAMIKARNPKENRFIIFLSDGEPMPNRSATGTHGNKNPYDFQNGTDVPTTFTVYFVSGKQTVPPSIDTMTTNIQNNNYSSSNPQSGVWGIQTSYDTLLNVLMSRALIPIFTSIKKEPTKLILNGQTFTDYQVADSSFVIPNIKLNDPLTNFNLKINYSVNRDSAKIQDTSAVIKFSVLRSDSLPMSEGVVMTNCEDTIFYQVSVEAPDPTASEKGPSNGVFRFTRSNSDHGDLTVFFNVTGTATPGSDYTKIADSVVFTGSQKSVSVTVTPVTDTLKEPNETVQVTLLNSKPNRIIRYKLLSAKEKTIVIDDYIVDSFKIAIVQNPFQIQGDANKLSDMLPPSKREAFRSIIDDKNGSLITIFSSRPLEHLSNDPNSYGKAVIYDAVGNIVKNLDLKKAAGDTTYYGMLWDGTNKNNRIVGPGAYLMKVKITNTAGVKKLYSEKVGIKF